MGKVWSAYEDSSDESLAFALLKTSRKNLQDAAFEALGVAPQALAQRNFKDDALGLISNEFGALLVPHSFQAHCVPRDSSLLSETNWSREALSTSRQGLFSSNAVVSLSSLFSLQDLNVKLIVSLNSDAAYGFWNTESLFPASRTSVLEQTLQCKDEHNRVPALVSHFGYAWWLLRPELVASMELGASLCFASDAEFESAQQKQALPLVRCLLWNQAMDADFVDFEEVLTCREFLCALKTVQAALRVGNVLVQGWDSAESPVPRLVAAILVTVFEQDVKATLESFLHPLKVSPFRQGAYKDIHPQMLTLYQRLQSLWTDFLLDAKTDLSIESHNSLVAPENKDGEEFDKTETQTVFVADSKAPPATPSFTKTPNTPTTKTTKTSCCIIS